MKILWTSFLVGFLLPCAQCLGDGGYELPQDEPSLTTQETPKTTEPPLKPPPKSQMDDSILIEPEKSHLLVRAIGPQTTIKPSSITSPTTTTTPPSTTTTPLTTTTTMSPPSTTTSPLTTTTTTSPPSTTTTPLTTTSTTTSIPSSPPTPSTTATHPSTIKTPMTTKVQSKTTITQTPASNQSSTSPSLKLECPPFTVDVIPSNPLLEQKIIREAVLNVWRVGVFRSPTPLLTQLQNIIVKMAQSDSLHFTRKTLQFTAWAAAVFPHIRDIYPSFCPMAKVMNLTIEWRKSEQKTHYLASLEAFKLPALFGHKQMEYTILKNQGCSNLTIPTLPRDCWNNGFAFKKDYIWNYYGFLLPWSLHYVVNKLAKSELFEELAAATLLSYTLSPQLQIVWGNLNSSIPLEFIKMYTASANNQLPVCCCGQYGIRLHDLVDYLDHQNEDSIKDEISDFVNKC